MTKREIPDLPFFLVVLEGPDGSGKTTVSNALQTLHPDWVYCKQPDPRVGTGTLIRAVTEGLPWAREIPSEALFPLFLANILDSLARVQRELRSVRLRKKRSRGPFPQIVVMDRYTLSTLVYQSEEWNPEDIAGMYRGRVPTPNLTFLLTAQGSVLRKRAKSTFKAKKMTAADFDALAAKYETMRGLAWSDGRIGPVAGRIYADNVIPTDALPLERVVRHVDQVIEVSYNDWRVKQLDGKKIHL